MFGTVSDARQSSTVYEEILSALNYAERYFQVSEDDLLSPSSQLIGQEAMLEMLDALKLNESDKSVLQSLIYTKPVSGAAREEYPVQKESVINSGITHNSFEQVRVSLFVLFEHLLTI